MGIVNGHRTMKKGGQEQNRSINLGGEKPSISVITPVYNEEESLPVLYQRLLEALEQLDEPWELIFVDDGSRDGSFEVLTAFCHRDPRVTAVQFRRNFGQTSALAAGFDYARGDVLVTLDADLQNDPADIPRLLEKLGEGYDIVSGWRKARKDPLFGKRIPSLLSNKLSSWITGVPLHDFGCTLKAYRREVIDEIHLYGEFHRFIPALASSIGASVTEIEVNHLPRKHGISKYGASRVIRGFLDLLTLKLLLNYMTKPMQMFGGLGLLTMGTGGLLGIATLGMKFFMGIDVTGNPMLYLTILFLILGIQFIGLGFVGELTMRTYHETQQKPTYVVREVIGGEPREAIGGEPEDVLTP